ncbi:MAG: hypothetical protein KIT73_08070, partial [Burkholderiales bacterium]|nr:hypothetical protein [Burkholderiales bacterium]
MSRLPDPRPVPVIPDDFRFAAPLRALADPAAGGDRSRVRETLVGALRKRMVAGDDATVRSVLDQAAPGSAALAVRAALDDAIQRAGDDEAVPLLARIFLMPVLFVAGGKAPATVPGVIPDMEAVTGLMRRAGALGPVENFGLANALGSIEAAEAVMPSRLFALAREIGAADGAALLPPADLDIATADEHVQLRYLAGASVTAADMPTFVETAGQVGRWGMAVSQAIAERLAEPGLSLLPLPRAPQPWFRALAEGRFAREELAFNLFAAAAIRRI